MNNENSKLCSDCGGSCCSHSPGIFSPGDFGNTGRQIGEKLRAAIAGGLAVFDYWEPDRDLPQTFYPRPPIKDVSQLVHPAFGGACALLSEAGCRLEFEKRPFGCRDLKPSSGFPVGCESESGSLKLEEVRLWRPYQRIIKRIVEAAQ